MRKSRLSKSKQDRLIEHFVAGTTARTVSVLVGVNKNTASYYFLRLRQLIYKSIEDETPFSGDIEVDESYFGGKRKGKRGRGAAGKVPVFGILKRGGKVYMILPVLEGHSVKRVYSLTEVFDDNENKIKQDQAAAYTAVQNKITGPCRKGWCSDSSQAIRAS